jgi:hypothetical protein
MPVPHALKVGSLVRVNVQGAFWRVKAIAALPGDCKPFFLDPPAILSGSRPSWQLGGLLGGRLILRANS